MNGTPRIAGAGICCLDYLVRSGPVAWGGTADILDCRTQGGGLAATALVACARLGADTVFFSRVGDDEEGLAIVRELEKEGVSAVNIMTVCGMHSPVSIVHVNGENGERTIFHRRASCTASLPSLSAIDACDVLLIDDYYPDLAIAAAERARSRGIPVVADFCPTPARAKLIALVDVLIAPRHFTFETGLKDNLPAALERIHTDGPDTAVITLGAEGWVSSGTDGYGRGDAYRVDVVDTTGAGDVFHGAYAFALARGAATKECCTFASAVAAMKCTAPGGRSGIPNLSAVCSFIQEAGGPLPAFLANSGDCVNG